MRSWRDELAAQVAAGQAGDVAIAALLVAGTERLVLDSAAACSVLPCIDGVDCREVAPGVVRVSAVDKQAAADKLSQLRGRLDAKSVASAVEWAAAATVASLPQPGAQNTRGAEAETGSARTQQGPEEQTRGGEEEAAAQRQLPATAAKLKLGQAELLQRRQADDVADQNRIEHSGDQLQEQGAATAAASTAHGTETGADGALDAHSGKREADPTAEPDPPQNPMVALAASAMDNSSEFLSEGWAAHKVIAKGTVDLWRKPVEGAAIDAVKVRGTVIPLGVGIAGVAALMKDESIKCELSKSTPSPIGTIEKLDSFSCMLGGEKLVVDLFYQENKFPWPMSNRHACYVACHRRLPDGRYVFVESTVEHDECRRRAGSSGVIWSFVNTILLEESGDNVITTVSSSFDIGGDIPMSTMNLLIEDMAGLFKDWNKLLADRPPMVEQVLEQMALEEAEKQLSREGQPQEGEEAAATSAEEEAATAAAQPQLDIVTTVPTSGSGELPASAWAPAVDVLLPNVQQYVDSPDGISSSSVSAPAGRLALRPIIDWPDQLSVVVLGDRGAGTTSLITRARTGCFENTTKPTVGADGATHCVRVPGYRCKLRVWDCASIADGRSPKEMKQVVARLIRRADIVLITYEEPSQATCVTIKLARETLKSSNSSALVVGVMTKADQKRKIKKLAQKEAEAATETIQTMSGMQHFVTSAKTGYGVAHLFETVIGQVVISRSWQPGYTAAAQRRAWAQVCAQHKVPSTVAAAVARRLHGGCIPWSVAGQARVDSAAVEASMGRWRYALYDLTIANAVFTGSPELRAATRRALLHSVQITIPRAELVTDSATGTEHTTYVLRCRAATGNGNWAEQFVSRRYSEFVALHTSLQLRAPGSARTLAPLPPKRAQNTDHARAPARLHAPPSPSCLLLRAERSEALPPARTPAALYGLYAFCV
jgi:GTPase SAR1 family protein